MTKLSGDKPEKNNILAQLSLGKAVEYAQTYAPELLQAVPRSLSRDEIGLTGELPFWGEDLWNGYELSWLNSKGKPQVAMLRCTVPFDTPNLIESKSFKLYLNSFNQTRLPSSHELHRRLKNDLSACAGGAVKVEVILPAQFSQQPIADLAGKCIDELDIEIDAYQLSPQSLTTLPAQVTETLMSNLLKSNCLITNQPDWASVMIKYQGNQIERESLLRYLISFRMHNEFHEQCVERIFTDIKQYCKPDKLTVYARYTRRGGLDINPFRSDFEHDYDTARQARQ
ncbi:NADPH-dependent 7-cyano-7-deazaguanine reductase QueF [Aliiglaciecola sp. LCG003]|uniref:NADPH-dependent 7-cyano-7-deazaguanine reductase QueF n=1 Tax=Aliiglaciecola sp. LCG003 TaxID=3053655 RepID=UPI002574055D|nr:NADPH-dependent 7-cyano-7-deazaguanine reductase QueF [Aliiglaciecola sp. LCG003]WJG10418.1 NADPH-dependent 7-cyano-7-deazaguanine reductase QueF [Aliiglaciecola sp. LCG003]